MDKKDQETCPQTDTKGDTRQPGCEGAVKEVKDGWREGSQGE